MSELIKIYPFETYSFSSFLLQDHR